MQETQVDPWGKIPWSRKWQPTPVLLTGEFHRQESGGLKSRASQRVGHDWATNTFTYKTPWTWTAYMWTIMNGEFSVVYIFCNSSLSKYFVLADMKCFSSHCQKREYFSTPKIWFGYMISLVCGMLMDVTQVNVWKMFWGCFLGFSLLQ